MSKHYTCELCKKEFNQKIDFTRHQNKKAPCISLTEMQQISQTKEVKTEFKTNLSTIFKYCLDVLRNNEHLTGDKALRTLAHLLDLRLLEPKFGNQIDIDTYDYDFSSYEDEIIEILIDRDDLKHKASMGKRKGSTKKDKVMRRYYLFRKAYKKEGRSQQQVAHMFNLKEHATVIHGLKQVGLLIETKNKDFIEIKKEYDRIFNLRTFEEEEINEESH